MQLADNNQQQQQTLYKSTGLKHTDFIIKNSTILFETNKRNAYRNSEVTVFLKKYEDDIKDGDLTVRWSSGQHYWNNTVDCFELAFNIKTGKITAKYEHVHPEHVKIDENQNGSPLTNHESIGLKFVKRDSPAQKVTSLEVHQKFNSKWRLVFNVYTPDYFVWNYPYGCQIAVKLNDGNNDGRIAIRDMSVVEVEY